MFCEASSLLGIFVGKKDLSPLSRQRLVIFTNGYADGRGVLYMEIDYHLILGTDKQLHFISCAVISILSGILTILISKRQSVIRNLCVMWMVLVTLGVLEEYRQYFVPNRSAELLDGVANLLGVTFGLVVPVLIYYMIIHRNHRLMKLLFLYGMILTPLLLGLMFINEGCFRKVCC